MTGEAATRGRRFRLVDFTSIKYFFSFVNRFTQRRPARV